VTRLASLVAGLCLVAGSAAAQSNLRNARVETRPGTDLAGAVQRLSGETGPVWIGYAVPAQDPDAQACCYDSGRDGAGCCGRCLLDEERSGGRRTTRAAADGPVQLEAAGRVVVLYRVEHRDVQRVRAYSESCELDAGGRTVYWLTDVGAAASVDVLLRLASRPVPDGDRRHRVADGAMHAIAAHRDPAADRALAALMAKDRPAATRRQAAFWAANARGRAGFDLVRAALLDTSNPEAFRKHATFAISQSREAEAVETLTRVARRDASATVRGEAIFWLAQKAGRRAAEAITDAIANDPETKVKERAVFALSQLPNQEGVPKLIEVARTNRNPAVRKHAMFWLGQSRDPRALAFFQEVLARP
jgi:HEAT repeat protein